MRLHQGQDIRTAIFQCIAEEIPGLRSLEDYQNSAGWRSTERVWSLNVTYEAFTTRGPEHLLIVAQGVAESLARGVLRGGILHGMPQMFERVETTSIIVRVVEMEPSGDNPLAEAQRLYAERYRLIATQCESALPPFVHPLHFHKAIRKRAFRGMDSLDRANRPLWTPPIYTDTMHKAREESRERTQQALERELVSLWTWYMGVVRGETRVEDER